MRERNRAKGPQVCELVKADQNSVNVQQYAG